MTLLAAPLQRYFTDYAHAQRDLSPNTIASYRRHLAAADQTHHPHTGIAADRIDLAVIDTDLVTSFLDQLTTARHNSVATCNARLTAIRAVLAQALPDHPEHADTITRVLAIPSRRRPAPTVEFLTIGETESLLAAPTPAPGPAAATKRCWPWPFRRDCGSVN